MIGRSGTFYRAGYLCRQANDWPDGSDEQTEDTPDARAQGPAAMDQSSVQQAPSASPVLLSENIPPAGLSNDAQNLPRPSVQGKQGLGGGSVRSTNGAPQMPKTAPLTGQQLRQKMDAIQPLLNSCRTAFSREIPGFSMNTFLNRMHNATYNQFTDPERNPLRGSSVEADTPPPGRTTNLYPNYFTDTPERQGAVLAHENIHRYTGWNDPQVFGEFERDGLTHRAYDVSGNTDEITDWILRGCKPKE